MRFLLLLSALLSAMVGSGAYARPACALTHQSVGVAGVSAPKTAEAAQDSRPVTGLPRVVDRLADDARSALVDPVAGSLGDAPRYAMRLRI